MADLETKELQKRQKMHESMEEQLRQYNHMLGEIYVTFLHFCVALKHEIFWFS